MAITLRNKKVEERIRAIGRRTGEGPSAVIARLVEAEEPGPGRVSEEEAERRYQQMRAFLDSFPKPTAEELAASKAFESDMYDEDGLPR